MDKAQEYLALARKAGLLAVGEERCAEAFETGRARLLLLASDASETAGRRAKALAEGRSAPLAALPWTKEELSRLTGAGGCAMLCFADLGLAGRFASALAETRPEWKETAALLEARGKKARRRKAAPRKHEPAEGKRRM